MLSFLHKPSDPQNHLATAEDPAYIQNLRQYSTENKDNWSSPSLLEISPSCSRKHKIYLCRQPQLQQSWEMNAPGCQQTVKACPGTASVEEQAKKAYQQYCSLPLHYKGEASTTSSLPSCISSQDISDLARNETWSSLRHLPKAP